MRLERVIAVRTGKTVYKDGEDCVKVFERDFPKADILHEAMNQAAAEEAGLPVPAVRGVAVMEGKWAIFSAYIRGKSLDRLIRESPEREEEYLALLVREQRRLQMGKRPLFARLKDKLAQKIEHADLDAPLRCGLLARLEELPGGDALCHGDFVPSNLLLSDEGKNFVLDWSHAFLGNADADTACTLLALWAESGRRTAGSYLSLACAQSGTAKENILRFLPFLAAAKLGKARGKAALLYRAVAEGKENFTL